MIKRETKTKRMLKKWNSNSKTKKRTMKLLRLVICIKYLKMGK